METKGIKPSTSLSRFSLLFPLSGNPHVDDLPALVAKCYHHAMSQPVKISDELILDARLTAEIAERSIAGQIEFWRNSAERSNHCSKAPEHSPSGGPARRPAIRVSGLD